MDKIFEIELMRLLCQLAAVDGEVVEVERDAIFRRARSHHVPPAAIAAQEAALAAGDLPSPDMAILRTHVAQTRSAARNLLAIDGVLDDAEIAAFERLDVALST